ncbi:MAG: hypothetical protein CVV47_16360 [Spirochaetae bacterium HGW-Spirochaetae-3]|jgi:hypothetical protein|nr:MAG: hypothetical protein CVV47_16360 [Spirochaetae bacterium HGW-Spirochaetae-3]
MLFLCIAAAGADGPRYVYEIRESAATKDDPWSMNMGIVAEAARLYSPVSFSKSGRRVSIALDTTLSFSLTRSADIERSDTRTLVRHEVLFKGDPMLPKATKRSTIRFSLSDIVKKGGPYAGSPLMFALRKAIEGSPYRSGRAWIISSAYDEAGRFTIIVALAKE